MSYLLDANAYVEAKNSHYRMAFCPGFWSWLDSAYDGGKIASITLVYKELSEYGDQLSDWVKLRSDHFLSVDDPDTQRCFSSIAEHVMALPLPKHTEKIRFLSGADPWLIAKAKVTGFSLVTHEVLVPENSAKIKIPNICKHYGVSYLNTFDLLETLAVSLVLESQP